MILLRGIKGEQYARRIEQGIVDCRDILSALLQPPETGYNYSNYYEENLVKALCYFSHNNSIDLHDPAFLHSLLIDYFIPHMYMTFFHVLNEHSIEWLEQFDEDVKYIAVDVKLDRITRMAIGNEYFGGRMRYVDSILELNQDELQNFQAACMCSIENLFENKLDMILPVQIYNTLSFPLLCREQDDKFTDFENEFRIITYDCPRVRNGKLSQNSRMAILKGKSGTEYRGILKAGEDTIFKSKRCILNDIEKPLSRILIKEKGRIYLESQFKSIEIKDISDSYCYIGDKKQCKDFIKKMLKKRPREKYVNRTVLKKYDIGKMQDAIYFAGKYKVEY